MMSTHKITAGHGYTYLTRQVAAQDASAVPPGGLAEYYSERGEAPGTWLGSGLAGVGITAGATVSEEQMTALFGEGRHPDAVSIERALRAEGADDEVIAAATELGTPFELNVANNEYLRQVAQLMTEWNRANGQAACSEVPDWMKARIRTTVAQVLFEQQHGRAPADAHELSSFVATQSRIGSRAVAGFDLTFSPVKSVSALWALAPLDVARQIEAAHAIAVGDTMAWLEREATFTRLGRKGIRQVDARGLIAAAFVHRTSRAGDPDLHTHVAVSNKVQTLDGRWRALDGRVLLKATVAASERYNTRLEAELRERLGIGFVDHERPGRRPVREIVGVDQRLIDLWSSRRQDIEARHAELSARFQAEHGRPPTPVESIELAQRATLETRPVKHDPESEGEQRRAWRAQAATVVPSLEAVLSDALRPTAVPYSPTPDALREVALRVIERVEADRASWQRWHVIAETQRQVRSLHLPAASLGPAVETVVETALGEYSVALTRADNLVEPAQLRRGDGSSVYSVAGSQLYTSSAVLKAERTLIDAAQCFDGRRVPDAAIEMALLESTANGLTLNDGQAAFVRELAGSGARCQLALAPAGTGKTTAVRVLARAWVEAGGNLVALAPSAAAARVLGEATGVPADTIAKALLELDRGGLQLTARTLVVVDEAGMASTPDLARLVRRAVAGGASVRLVGDDRQLAAIGAGGVLRDLAETTDAVSLAAAVRFENADEAAAALAVREGRIEAVDYYAEAGRIHVGDAHTAAQSAYDAWAADRAAGKDALLLATTRKQVTLLNRRARADRLVTGSSDGREVQLADGCALSAGDVIVTRRNDRRLGITATDWVKNGDRWTVHAVQPNGDVVATHHDTGRHVTLPAGYVAEHVDLGYATTIHAAQGRTADTCHVVLTGAESREQLYVAMTRGRQANHVHVALPGAADDHAPVRPDTLLPPTARDLLLRVLEREEAARSATSEAVALANPARLLGQAVDRYVDALSIAPLTPDAPPSQPAPLPWLEPVPTCRDDSWQAYLDARAQQIIELADTITSDDIRRGNSGTVIRRRDPTLLPHFALWETTHRSGDKPLLSRELLALQRDDEEHPLTAREELYRRHLAARFAALKGTTADHARRWVALVGAVDPKALSAPEYPQLAEQLSRAFASGVDVDRTLPRLLAERDYAKAPGLLAELAHMAEADELARTELARARAPRHVPSYTPWMDPSIRNGYQHEL